MDYTREGVFTPGKYGEWRFDKRSYSARSASPPSPPLSFPSLPWAAAQGTPSPGSPLLHCWPIPDVPCHHGPDLRRPLPRHLELPPAGCTNHLVRLASAPLPLLLMIVLSLSQGGSAAWQRPSYRGTLSFGPSSLACFVGPSVAPPSFPAEKQLQNDPEKNLTSLLQTSLLQYLVPPPLIPPLLPFPSSKWHQHHQCRALPILRHRQMVKVPLRQRAA